MEVLTEGPQRTLAHQEGWKYKQSSAVMKSDQTKRSSYTTFPSSTSSLNLHIKKKKMHSRKKKQLQTLFTFTSYPFFSWQLFISEIFNPESTKTVFTWYICTSLYLHCRATALWKKKTKHTCAQAHSVLIKVCRLLSAGAHWLVLCHWDHLAANSRWYDKHSSAVTQTHTKAKEARTLCLCTDHCVKLWPLFLFQTIWKKDGRWGSGSFQQICWGRNFKAQKQPNPWKKMMNGNLKSTQKQIHEKLMKLKPSWEF